MLCKLQVCLSILDLGTQLQLLTVNTPPATSQSLLTGTSQNDSVVIYVIGRVLLLTNHVKGVKCERRCVYGKCTLEEGVENRMVVSVNR
jgi:hypothetical protein